tara:strand:+ start:475 stop:1143 length:669 start_codon:yes stop_codon:yes gene_type:complete
MKNLYSILSNKGRMGDTELRYVSGELAHVNKNEAYILDKYGKTGEDFIKENGSGTINPETGLKEYFIIEGLMAAKFAYDLYKGNEQRKAGERVSKEIDKQINSLQGQFDEIDLNTEDLLQNLTERSELKERDLFSDFLTKSEDIQSSGDLAISKANLATSGGILENLNKRRDDLLTEFDEKSTALEFQEEDRTLGILTDSENAKQALSNQILSLEATKASYG